MNLFPNSTGGKPCPVSVPATRFRALHLSAFWRPFLAPPCGLGSRTVWLVVLAAMLMGCGSGSDSDKVPVIAEFHIVGGGSAAEGETVTFRWAVTGSPVPSATLTDVTHGPVHILTGASGTFDLVPEGSGDFTLRAVNRSGNTSGTVSLDVVPAPSIEVFELEGIPEDGVVLEGATYRVVWEIDGPWTQIQLDGERMEMSPGGKDFVASEDTTHRLRVTWFGGERMIDSEPLEVVVLEKPVITSFTATPAGVVDFGTDVELSWAVEGGDVDSIFITEEGGGAVAFDATSYTRAAVTNTITHQLEVRNEAGASEAEVTIEVDPESTPYGLLKVHNGRVVVMRPGPVSGLAGLDAEYVPALGRGIQVDALAWMGGEFYRHFADVFDFLIFVGALEADEASVYSGDEWPWYDDQYIFSEEPGLGRRDIGAKTMWSGIFGSERDELRGLSFHPHMGDLREGPSLRELVRHWGVPFVQTVAHRAPCNARLPNEARGPDGECGSFWPPIPEGYGGFSSNNGQLGGFDGSALSVVESSVNGEEYVDVFRAGRFSPFGPGDNSVPYSEWELYAAGMVAAGEVASTLVTMPYGHWYVDSGGAQMFDVTTGDPLFLNVVPGSPAVDIADSFDGWVWYDDMDYIVRTKGERVPESPGAAQAFVGAVVLVVDGTHLPDDAALDRLAVDVSWLSNPAPDGDPMFNFFEATGGRGQLLLEQLDQHRLQTPGSAEALPARVRELSDRLGVELP